MHNRRLEQAWQENEPSNAEHSLPSYNEPTPEKREKMSREQEAELALKNTFFTPGARTLLVSLFLLTIVSVPIGQLLVELRNIRAQPPPDVAGFSKLIPQWTKLQISIDLWELWKLLPGADQLKTAEKALENQSFITHWLLQQVQSVLTKRLHTGNEHVYHGRGRWLFYRADVDYVTGPPFLDPARMKQRASEAGVQPDPVKCIVDFRDQLASRRIDLIVMPVPVKPCIDGEMLARKAQETNGLQNASFAEFKARIERSGVRIFDPGPLMMTCKAAAGGVPIYLETDTHWRPETMEFVARQLAAFIEPHIPGLSPGFRVAEKTLSAPGDTFTMLKLPSEQNIFRPQLVTIREVIVGNTMWRPSTQADILLLGDSFCNIYSLEQMGWGESAGFAEHLSLELGGRPLDCILHNSDGSFATREILSRQLARGRDRLAGKGLVVWEFAVRELSFGDWKFLAMKTRQPQPTHFLSLRPGEKATVTGIVEAVSAVPIAGSVPYKDHVMTVQLVDFKGPQQREGESLQAVVFLWSMRDNVWTPAARLRPGDRVTLGVRAWADVSAQYEKFNRSEIDDSALELEEPLWAEFEE